MISQDFVQFATEMRQEAELWKFWWVTMWSVGHP